jgi:hypothetical protein
MSAVVVPVCVYDGQVSAECATLVSNPGFEQDIAPWKAEDGLLGAWSKNDAQASDHSGSIRIVNLLHGTTDGVAPGAGVQCIPAKAGRIYDMAGDVFITDGQGDGLKQGDRGMTGAPYTGKAGFSMFFFARPDCKENSIGNADSPLTDQVGAWAHIEGVGTAPEQTQSLAVRLNTLKPFREFKFEALFDNIFVRQR